MDPAAATPADEQAALAFVREFLRAFEDLDLPRFAACFAADASVFFPAPEPPRRVEGAPAIEERFAQVFAGIRAGAAGGPPYHHLEPERLAARPLGGGAVLVSFELHDARRIARRSLVLARLESGWRIVHLHASNAGPG